MPVRVALPLDDSFIVVLGNFPTGRAGRANMKGSDAIGAHERGREQRSRHWCQVRSIEQCAQSHALRWLPRRGIPVFRGWIGGAEIAMYGARDPCLI
jgi:hypothetical protein